MCRHTHQPPAAPQLGQGHPVCLVGRGVCEGQHQGDQADEHVAAEQQLGTHRDGDSAGQVVLDAAGGDQQQVDERQGAGHDVDAAKGCSDAGRGPEVSLQAVRQRQQQPHPASCVAGLLLLLFMGVIVAAAHVLENLSKLKNDPVMWWLAAAGTLSAAALLLI